MSDSEKKITEDPKEEATIEEMVEDIQTLGSIVQKHDQTLFQLISSINGLQKLLMEKDTFSVEELTSAVETEALALQKKISKISLGDREQEPENSDSSELDTEEDGNTKEAVAKLSDAVVNDLEPLESED